MISIDELLMSKDFKELLAEEKEFVLNQFSEIQYDSYRKLILKAKSQFKEENTKLNPKPFILENIKKHIGQSQKLSGFRLVKYPVPAYQFISIAAMMLLVVWLVFNHEQGNNNHEVQYVYKTDTVFIPDIRTENTQSLIQKKVMQPKSVNNEKYSTPKPDKKNKKDNHKQILPHNNFRYGLQVNIDEFINKQNLGENFSTNQDLKQFIVAIN